MKANHLLYFALVLVCGLVACAENPSIQIKQPLGEPTDLLLKFEWDGPESRPLEEVGFAGERRSDELNQWLAETPLFRSGSVLSKSECSGIVDVLRSGYFQARRVARLDDLANLQQQYYLSVSAKGEMWYIPLGVDKEGKAAVVKIKEVLAASSASLLNPIIAFFPQ